MITWSTCVHDLNPTENLCYHLKWEIHTKGKLYTTLNRLKLNTGCDKVRWLTKHWGNTGKKYFFLYNLYFSHNSYGSLRIQDVVHCMYAPVLLTAHVKCCCPTFPQLSKNIPGNCRISKEDNRRTFSPICGQCVRSFQSYPLSTLPVSEATLFQGKDLCWGGAEDKTESLAVPL